MKRLFPVAAIVLIAIGTVSASESGALSSQDVIEMRRAGFKKMGAAMKAIAEQLKSDAPDISKVTAATQAIASGVREQPNWFPVGSGPESGVDTDALPHIWKDTAKFAALSSQLATESGNFAAAVASNNLAAIRTQFKVLAEVCSTCHKSFRAD
jgi:cytochrome c556